jgi:hypothetical protein
MQHAAFSKINGEIFSFTTVAVINAFVMAGSENFIYVFFESIDTLELVKFPFSAMNRMIPIIFMSRIR